jgi:hypothetical protein
MADLMEIAPRGCGLQVIDYTAVTDGGISLVMGFSVDVNFQKMIEPGCSIIRDMASRNRTRSWYGQADAALSGIMRKGAESEDGCAQRCG